VVNWAVKILTDVPKPNERKLNLHFTSFKAKGGKTETKKELVQQLNIKLL
jgi:hypothetical protein